MKTATGLALLAIGAILAFAVSAHTPGVNLEVAGLVIMATGAAGMLMPGRASDWLRGRVIVRRPSGGVVGGDGDLANRPYLAQSAGDLASEILYRAQLAEQPEASQQAEPDSDWSGGEPDRSGRNSIPRIGNARNGGTRNGSLSGSGQAGSGRPDIPGCRPTYPAVGGRPG